MKRLAVVTNIPTPYRVPLFNTLAPALREHGWELDVVFGSRGNQRRLWKIGDDEFAFPHHFLEGANVRFGRERIMNTYAGLTPWLEEHRPEGIVCTGYSPGTMAASRYARKADVPLAIWSGAIRSRREREWWRVLQRRWLVKRCDRFLAYGTGARDYLKGLGAPEDRIHIAWNTVDTAGFDTLKGARAPEPGRPLRLLSVGYLEKRKRVDLVIQAVAAARREGLDVEVEIAGDGSQRAALEQLAIDLDVRDHVRFLGYLDYQSLKVCYERAHAMAFSTSNDIWGLVLVEAMAAGLPCLSSTRAGGTRDLVVEGETGFAVNYKRTRTVVDRLRELCDDGERAAGMGRAARDRIREQFTLRHSAGGWLSMVDQW